MNRQLFLQLLEHPDSVSEPENIALKKFTEDFPYCQTGRLLFVKHLHSQKSVHYPEQLKIAAAYVADRKVLYNLIHSPASLTSSVSLREPPSPKGEGTRAEEVVMQVPEIIIPEKKIEKVSSVPSDIIQKRLREISAFKKEEPVPAPAPVPIKEEVAAPEPKIVQQKEVPKPKEITGEKKVEDIKSAKHSFTQWLRTVKKDTVTEPGVMEKKSEPVSSTDEIITRFIETEPRIIPSKAEFYNPVKMAKQSLEEHDDLVSETLAGIFAEQGNLPKAIEMYRKLMLSNPEKSSFFATLIEKLAQQLKEGK